MQLTNKPRLLLGFFLVFSVLLIFGYLSFSEDSIIVSTVNTAIANQSFHATLEARRNDYKLDTTPLPQVVIDDICSQFEIWDSSNDCQSSSTLYAPDFFDEIKAYFNNLPGQNRTLDEVQSKLGKYFVRCDEPSSDGRYRCYSNLNNDHQVYSIIFFFNNEGFYEKVIANKRVGDT